MIPFEEFCKRRQQILLEVESKIEKMYFKEDSALEDMVNKKKKKINDLFEKAFSIIKKKDNIEEPEEKLIVENLFVYLEKLLNEKKHINTTRLYLFRFFTLIILFIPAFFIKDTYLFYLFSGMFFTMFLGFFVPVS